MLSAVETYGAAVAYAHHQNFSIAAAAAAAGTAAAAAAAVIPSQQAALEHHHHMLAAHSSLNGAGLLLPSTQLPSPEGTARSVTSRSFPSASLVNSKNTLNNSLASGPVSVTMSSAEFLRPHPKQPRYNGHSANNSASSPNASTDLTGNSNGLPLHMRGNKIGNSSNLSNSPPSRPKYSSDQSGAVNLVTSNNNSNSSGSSTMPPNKVPSVESLPPQTHSPSEREIIAGMYSAKNITFPAGDPTAAAAAYQYSKVLAANRTLYSDPSFYVAHSIARGQLHPRAPYLPEQFSAYLHPHQSAYSPTGPTTLLGPPPTPSVVSSQLGSPHSASSLLSNSHNNSANSPLSTTQLPLVGDRHSHAGSVSSLHHPSSPHLPQAALLNMERQQTSFSKDKEMKTMNQLNGKSNLQLENQAGFKVPSGKEGSMKHRILTRPHYGEKDIGRHRSPISTGVLRNSSSTSTLTNFTKGSLIELTTGELRRVEDMRTEDFVQSAERSQHLELADSTVVKISSNSHSVSITFSYNKNRSKVDIDASLEHPFFVYGQGWASCNPELTLKTYGLKCQRLQVGDVCISLKPRESSQSQQSSNTYGASPHSPTNYPSPNHQYKDDARPQNLSRKSSSSSSSSSSSNLQTSTIPTTATGTTVSSRLSAAIPQLPPMVGIPPHLSGVHQTYEMLHTYATSPPVSSQNSHHISPNAILSQHHQHQLQRQIIEGHVVLARNNNNSHRSPPLPPPLSSGSRPSSNQQPYYLGSGSSQEHCNGQHERNANSTGSIDSNQLMCGEQDTAIDASTSRKRRWSWSNPPILNERESGATPPKTVCNAN